MPPREIWKLVEDRGPPREIWKLVEDRDLTQNPVQSSPVQSSPVQSSPVQSSPVQSSPVQPSPVKVASPQVKCGRVWSSVVECGPVSSSVGEVRRVSSIDCCPRTSSPRGAPQEKKSSAEVVRRARAYLPACSKRRPLSLGPTLKLEAWKRPWKEPPSSWGSSSSRWPRCRCPWCLRRRASRRR